MRQRMVSMDDETPRKGEWFMTRSGQHYYPADPRVGDFNISDVAYALSRICRYGGHVPFYSVAEHCVRISYWLPRHLALQGLCHDAPEAYLGDVVRPLKSALPEYKKLEHKTWKAFSAQFRLPVDLHPLVKHYDDAALATERRDLFTTPFEFHCLPMPRSLWQAVFRFFGKRSGWPSWYARWRFLRRFKQLTRIHRGPVCKW